MEVKEIPLYTEFAPSLNSSPLFIGPKIPSDDHLYFSVYQKQNSTENIVISLDENKEPQNPNAKNFVNSNSLSPNGIFNVRLPTNALSIPTINMDSMINSNKESPRDSTFNKIPALDLKTTNVAKTLEHNENKGFFENNQLSAPAGQSSLITTTGLIKAKKIDIKKTLSAIIVRANPKLMIDKFLNSWPVTIVVNVLTVYVLFADDVRTATCGISADPIFDTMTLICLGIFSIEIIMSTFVRKGYFHSFFFYLDIISTITLLFDVVWFQEATLLKNNASTNATQLARMGRASRIGTRAARIIRLVRLFRIVKLYKSALFKQDQKNKKKEGNESPNTSNNPENKEPNIQLIKSNDEQNNKKISCISLSEPVNVEKKSLSIPRRSKFSNASPNAILSLTQKRPSRYSNAFDRPRLFSRLSHKWYMSPSHSNQSPHKSLQSPSSNHTNFANIESMIHESSHTEKDTLLEIQEELQLKESTVGKKLSEKSTKRVIILVLILIILIPLFDSRFFFDTSYSFLYGVAFLSKIQDPASGQLLVSSFELENFCNFFLASEAANKYSTMIFLSSPFYNTSCHFYQSLQPSELRFDEKFQLDIALQNGTISVVVDLRWQAYYSAIINMMRTIMVTFVLLSATLMFSRDANELILTPIERMIEKVHKIAENPLRIKELRFAAEKSAAHNELIMIENSILKIGTLLALGFGEAGREIIASNINKGGGVDPLIRGSRKYAVYGFCDIRNFTDATEVLQEEVMVFVNNIAEIVHSIVDRCLGSANKNIGDAFLLVWKLPDLCEEFIKSPTDSRKVTDICDLAVFSFLKIIGKLNRHQRILQYRTNPKLTARFKDYKVRLGFGMHYGWAIEGAIGSDYKIDASYLSPNVNLASRLEAATKQYGVPFLFSSELFRCLSEGIKRFSRRIDVVTLKGSALPLGLYTIDVVLEDMPPSKPEASKEVLIAKRRLQKEAVLSLCETKTFPLIDLFCYDKEIKLLLRRQEIEISMVPVFTQGLEAYLEGDWTTARQKLEAFVELKGEDRPSNVLLDFMKKSFWKCPEDWPGYRELVEK